MMDSIIVLTASIIPERGFGYILDKSLINRMCECCL